MNPFEELKRKVRAWETLDYLVCLLDKSGCEGISIGSLHSLMSSLVGERAIAISNDQGGRAYAEEVSKSFSDKMQILTGGKRT